MNNEFKKVLYGGDYNPEQWTHEIWQDDMRLLKNANIDTATINVFSWAKLQPNEETYDFSELDAIVEMLTREKFNIIMATSTAAIPAWMAKRYPEVMRAGNNGVRKKFGERHNFCPNSAVYKKYSVLLANKIAERYKNNKNIICWHICNEYGGTCYCDNCEKEFRIWLKNKYKNINAVNEAWNTSFWSHTIYDWDEIVVPNILGDGGWYRPYFAGLYLDYQRFNSESMLNCFKAERDAVKKHIPNALVTTNLMGPYKPLDYFKWAQEMDIVSWDNYPDRNTEWGYVAFTHDLMRGLKGKPFMLMEQTPSQQNWQKYCTLKQPGQMSAQSYQTIAHGADSVLFFQLRRSKGGCEKFHGAVISHSGSDKTRVYNEVKELGAQLNTIGNKIVGAKTVSEVALIFDWENYWAVESTMGPNADLRYVDELYLYYKQFYKRNISVDIISDTTDFSKYKVVAAPVLYMVKQGVSDALERYVKNGGILITGYMSGIVNESDNVYLGGYPGPLRKLAGVWVEEIDALAPDQSNTVRLKSGNEYKCGFLCDVIHSEEAETIAEYTSNFYSGMPAVTKNKFGKGYVYYFGTKPEAECVNEIFGEILSSGIISSVLDENTELEVDVREKDGNKYFFIMNFSGMEKPLPQQFIGSINIINGEKSPEVLKPFETVVVEK